MSCCCPPAVKALFCLWAKSGFSKGSVAGALTFFPPDPPLYRFRRIGQDGTPLPDNDDDYEEEDDDLSYDDDDEHLSYDGDEEKPLEESKRSRTGKKPKPDGRNTSIEIDMEEDDDLDPAQKLTKRALLLRKRAVIRNKHDLEDAEAGVTFSFVPDYRLAAPPSFSGTIEAIKIGPEKKTKHFIAAVIYRISPEKVTNCTKTLIYSHGNATDIGAMNFMQCVLAKGLKCNVVTYDYAGYGESGGVPMEHNTYRDIDMVYNHVVENVVRDKNENNIVIYGQSVGSGPSCYICSKKPDVGGLILHSPFMSGMRVLTPSRLLGCLDIFPNIDRIKRVNCPVMIIHGVQDQEVGIHHGKELYEAVPEELRRSPWWVADRGHNDITDGRAKLVEYIERLKSFFNGLDD